MPPTTIINPPLTYPHPHPHTHTHTRACSRVAYGANTSLPLNSCVAAASGVASLMTKRCNERSNWGERAGRKKGKKKGEKGEEETRGGRRDTHINVTDTSKKKNAFLTFTHGGEGNIHFGFLGGKKNIPAGGPSPARSCHTRGNARSRRCGRATNAVRVRGQTHGSC